MPESIKHSRSSNPKLRQAGKIKHKKSKVILVTCCRNFHRNLSNLCLWIHPMNYKIPNTHSERWGEMSIQNEKSIKEYFGWQVKNNTCLNQQLFFFWMGRMDRAKAKRRNFSNCNYSINFYVMKWRFITRTPVVPLHFWSG